MPLAVRRAHVHPLMELLKREGCLCHHGRIMIVAEFQAMVAIPARDRLLRPLAEWTLAVVVDAELIARGHLLD